jgi:hypothetical protein
MMPCRQAQQRKQGIICDAYRSLANARDGNAQDECNADRRSEPDPRALTLDPRRSSSWRGQQHHHRSHHGRHARCDCRSHDGAATVGHAEAAAVRHHHQPPPPKSESRHKNQRYCLVTFPPFQLAGSSWTHSLLHSLAHRLSLMRRPLLRVRMRARCSDAVIARTRVSTAHRFSSAMFCTCTHAPMQHRLAFACIYMHRVPAPPVGFSLSARFAPLSRRTRVVSLERTRVQPQWALRGRVQHEAQRSLAQQAKL